MGMAAQTNKLHLITFVLFTCWLSVSAHGENLLSCETTSPDASGYHCRAKDQWGKQCGTFAILRTNPNYSSLSNLTFYLGINRFVVAEANGFSADTEFLPHDQLLLIPIDCKCNNGLFQAELTKTTTEGESFFGIAESLGGLTTCRAIQEKNPHTPPTGLGNKLRLTIPLRCACPSSAQQRFLLSYPVRAGDTISNLALKFNITKETIISANNRSVETESLTPFTSLLIPQNGQPVFGPLAKPSEPNVSYPATNIPLMQPAKKKTKMWKVGLYIGLAGVIVGICIAVAVICLVIQLKRRKKNSGQGGDVELQQLSLSVRTTSDKKVSFEGSQDTHDGKTIDTTPKKMSLEIYTVEELKKATEEFSSSNHIEGAVFHGRLNGKNVAIKRLQTETMSEIEFSLFHDSLHRHPNILRMFGTCFTEAPESFLVFEYARNGSLKDWLHGGLAMKNQFISSCYCFLTWSQRLKICLDVAMALHYMHQVMNPSYVHRNIKSRNIFLDEDFNARIGNFGMAKCAGNATEVPKFYSTNPASWSLGYLAPEYIHQGLISTSIDIFAYGVVVLEILSGKTPITRPNEKGEGSIWLSEKIKYILQSENAEVLREWMDSALCEQYCFDGAVSLANIARACVEEEVSLRPTAGDIVDKLSSLVQELPDGGNQLISESSSTKPLVKAATAAL